MVKLYHGAPKTARKRIRREGLRRFTWTSTSKRDASEFGGLKGKERDIWEVRVDKRNLDKVAWKLGAKRGEWWKFFKKPPKPKLVKTIGKRRK